MKKFKKMICLFHRLCKNQQFPQYGFFFGEKAILEESFEPSLDKLRWPGIFWFLCSRNQLYMTVYVVLSPIVMYQWKEKKKPFWSVKFNQQSGRSFSLLEAGKFMIYEIVWQFMSWWACIKTSRMFFFMGWVFHLQKESAIKKPSDCTFSSCLYHKVVNSLI